MGRETRKEKLIKVIREQIANKEKSLSSPHERFTDQEYQKLVNEAIRLREMLKILKGES